MHQQVNYVFVPNGTKFDEKKVVEFNKINGLQFVEIPPLTFYLSNECITYAKYICKLIFTRENKLLVHLFIKI